LTRVVLFVLTATGTTVCTQTVKADAKQVTIQCPLEGEINWSKDDAKISADNKKYAMDATNRTLTIVKIGQLCIGMWYPIVPDIWQYFELFPATSGILIMANEIRQILNVKICGDIYIGC